MRLDLMFALTGWWTAKFILDYSIQDMLLWGSHHKKISFKLGPGSSLRLIISSFSGLLGLIRGFNLLLHRFWSLSPLNFFNPDYLKSIAGVIGRVLRLGGPTRALSRPLRKYNARVCVENDLLKPRPNRIWLGMGAGGKWRKIIYERVPKFCSHCMLRGHDNESCRHLLQPMEKREKT